MQLMLFKHLLDRRGLHHVPRIHHVDMLARSCDYTQVMGNQHYSSTKFSGKALHQFKNLGLNGYIQRCCWLIGDEQLRVACQGNGNHYALAHAATKFMRVVLRASLGVGNAYQLKHFDRALPGLVIADILAVTLDSLGYLEAHGEYRVERGHRVLENHGDLAAAQVGEFLAILLQDIITVKVDFTPDDLAGGAGYQAHYRESRYALATASPGFIAKETSSTALTTPPRVKK